MEACHGFVFVVWVSQQNYRKFFVDETQSDHNFYDFFQKTTEQCSGQYTILPE